MVNRTKKILALIVIIILTIVLYLYISKPKGTWTTQQNMNYISGKAAPGKDGDGVKYLGIKASAAACQTACDATPGCNAYTQHDDKQTVYSNMCYGITSATLPASVSETGHTSGKYVLKN